MKKIISSILSVLMVISGFSVLGTTALADENTENTIEVWNIDDLYSVRHDMSANYVLMADIDMTKDVADGGDYCFLGKNGWNPIGGGDSYKGTKFTGTFDGNNHIIKGLRIETNTIPSGTSDRYLGLFACNAGTIKNLSVDSVSIRCVESTSAESKYIGTICGYNSGTVDNCHVLGGTIDGYTYASHRCTPTPKTFLGGVVGYNNSNGVISKSSNNATISGSEYGASYDYKAHLYMGGISGANSGKIAQSYNSGNLKDYSKENYYGYLYEGGIAGDNFLSSSSSSITDCYNCGDVYNTTNDSISEYIYGIGYSHNPNRIKNCYNTGSVYYATTLKPFSNSTVDNCYYLNGKNESTSGATALSGVQMTKAINFSGFDFENTWIIDDSTEYAYPQLRDNRQDTLLQIDTIEFKTEPSKVKYRTGDEIKVEGTITVYYMNGTFEDIDITKDMLSGYDMSSVGDQTVTVTYRNKTLTYDINVVQRPNAVGVSLVSGPAKTEFIRDTKLDYSGAVAKIFYDDGTTENVILTPSNTTGADIKKSGTYIVTYTYESYTVNFTVKVVPLKITGIEVKSLPTKTTYIEGQSIDTDGLDIGLTRNDGSSESVKDYKLDYENKAGKQTVTVTYNGYITTFDVTFTERELLSLSVTEQPTKTSYFSDEKFDRTGMVVTASYNNGLKEEVTDYKTSEITDEIGTQIIEISYGGKSTYTAIEVIERSVESISVTKAPLKSSYVIGSDFDTTGMEVTAYYNDGTSKVVTDYYVSSLPTTLGEGTVKVSYGGKSTTINVTIKEKALVKIKVTGPKKTTYFKGEQLDTTGMVVYAVYNNKKSEPITDYVLSGFGDSDESNLVTVSYKSLTASFEVFIHNPSGEWIDTKEATCENAGEKVMYCTTCSEIVKREEIKALNHDYSEKVVKPTCTEKGYTEHTCKNCGDTYRDSYVKETGHNPITDYGKPATCKENGLTEGSHCNVCDTVLVPQQIIPKLNHSYTAQVTSVPSCTTRGSVTYTCQSCGDSYVVYQEASNHNFKLIKTVNATCTTPGYKQYACTECNENYSEQIPITDHKPVVDKAVEATCVKTGLTEGSHCSECGAVIVPQELVKATGHSYTKKVVAPTCKDKGYTVYECTKCKDSYIDDYKDTVGHDYVTTVTAPATCKKTGVKTSTCSVCGDKFTTTIPMIDHKEVTDKAVAPTCTKTGLTEGSHCSVCGDVITEQKVVKSLGHDYVETVVEPTCTDVGYTVYKCSVCGDTYKGNLKSTVDHIYAKKTVKPTCNSKGYTLYTCTLCGDSYKSNYVDTIDHEYKSSVTKEPTCTEEGIKKYTCTVCGDTYNESIPKTEHKYSEKVVAPTCTTDGYTQHTCDLCGDSYKDTITQKVDHNYNSVVTKEATCTEEGTKKYTCPTCGDTYTEKIPMTDHTVVIDKAVSATYTANGKTEGSHCSVCGKVIKPQRTIAKKKLAKPTGVKATAMSKSFKLNWKKVAGAKGYEIQYSYKINFSGAKKITVKSGNTTSQTVKKLTGKKKVYIRIRSFYNDKNGKAYSPWTVTNVTTKK